MDERKILSAACFDRQAFATLAKTLEPEEDLSDRGSVVWAAIDRWYNADPTSTCCEPELLLEAIVREHPKHAGIFSEFFKGIQPTSPANVVDLLLDLKLDALSNKMIQSLANRDKAKTTELAEKYNRLLSGKMETTGEGLRIFKGTSSEELVRSVRPENLMHLYPKSLNDAVGGGVPRGAHILIFAPPEVGKSMLCINMACGFLHEGRRVLYIGNEDAPELMLLRVKSRLTGMTRNEILENPALADERAERHGFNNLVFAAPSPGTIRDVGALCDEHEPDVVFVDQLSNLHTPNLSKVEALEWLAKQMRNISKSRNIVGISVTQAADSAIGKQILEMGDVYFSNIAIQAQVDVMIGIGMDSVLEAAGVRMLSLAKNKLTGNHTPVQVQVNPQLSKVT